METVVVEWEVSVSRGLETFEYDDLGVENQKEWEALPYDDQRERLQEAIDDLPERVSIIVDSFR